MAYDVFISHSSKDKPVADATCACLESHGIRCWIAPRDIRPGDEWGSAIGKAIRGARVMVLIFSSHANNSPQIRREVERAVHAGATIIPVRIEGVLPEDALEYFLGAPHWLDAFPPPLEQHLVRLATVINEILELPAPAPGSAAEEAVQKTGTDPAPPPPVRNRPSEPSRPEPQREPEKSKFPLTGLLIGLGSAAVVLVLCGLGYLIWGRPAAAPIPIPAPVVVNPAPATTTAPVAANPAATAPANNAPAAQPAAPAVAPAISPAPSSSVDPAVVGVWYFKLNIAKIAPGVMAETYNADGTYKSETVLVDSGTYHFGGGRWSMASKATGALQEGTYRVSAPQTLELTSATGPFPWTTTGAALDPDNPNFIGTWTGAILLPNSAPWQLTMTVKTDGTYSVQEDCVDGGTFTAANGSMSCQVRSSGTTVPMTYQSIDQDSMVFTSPLGPATWSRKRP